MNFIQLTNVYFGTVSMLGVAICPSPLPSYPIIRNNVTHVYVGVVTNRRVLIPTAHCFRASTESFNLSTPEERDQDRLGATFNINIFFGSLALSEQHNDG